MNRITLTLSRAVLALSAGMVTQAALAEMATQEALKTLLGEDAAGAARANMPEPAMRAQAPMPSPIRATAQVSTSSGGAWPLAPKDTGRITAVMPATAMNDDSRQTMTVPRGATLAILLAKAARQAGVPVKQLYQPFVALNPQAFVRGNANRLMAGVQVRMFSDADLAAIANGGMGAAASSSSASRRNWVHYP